MFRPSKKSRMKIRNATKSMQAYVGTYHKQLMYEEYSEETFIKDMIYGIAIALDEKKYQYANVYDKFIARIIDMHKPNAKADLAGGWEP